MKNLRTFIREVLREQEETTPKSQYDAFMEEVDKGEKASIFSLPAPLMLVHRSPNMDLTAGDLDPLAVRQTKQGKRGGEPKVGLYAYTEEDTEQPGVARYGDNKVMIEMPAGTKVLDLTRMGKGKSNRISMDTAQKLLADGVELITGFDFVGPQEWVILRVPPQAPQR